MYSSAVFTGGRPLCTQILLALCLHRVVPLNNSQQQKTRQTGVSNCEDRILLHSYVLTQYRSVTNGQICHSIYSSCKLALQCTVRNVSYGHHPGMWSRFRRLGLETHQCLVSISSWLVRPTSRSRLGLGL